MLEAHRIFEARKGHSWGEKGMNWPLNIRCLVQYGNHCAYDTHWNHDFVRYYSAITPIAAQIDSKGQESRCPCWPPCGRNAFGCFEITMGGHGIVLRGAEGLSADGVWLQIGRSLVTCSVGSSRLLTYFLAWFVRIARAAAFFELIFSPDFFSSILVGEQSASKQIDRWKNHHGKNPPKLRTRNRWFLQCSVYGQRWSPLECPRCFACRHMKTLCHSSGRGPFAYFSALLHALRFPSENRFPLRHPNWHQRLKKFKAVRD